MTQGSTVEFGDVFVVRETKTALLCRIGEKVRWVAHSRLQRGSTVEHPRRPRGAGAPVGLRR